MQNNSIEVLGLIRWSYPSGGRAFRSAQGDLEAKRAKLYASERLEHRLFLLEHVVLPCVRGQTDKDFKIAMLMGDQLPDPYRKRVLDLIADVPQIKPVFAEEGQEHDQLCRDTMNAMRSPNVAASAQFRLDDDDAIGLNFVKTTRDVFADIQPMYEKHGLFGLDFCRGFIMKSTEEDCNFHPISIRFWAPGMVIFIAPENDRCMLDFHHLRLWASMPVLMWMDKPMFVRGIHHDNDSDISNHGRRSRSFRFNPKRTQRFMRNHFGINAQEIGKLWAKRLEDETV